MKKRLAAAALAAAALVPALPSTTAGASGATLADVLLADSASDGPGGFDGRLFDYDIVTQAILATAPDGSFLFPDIVAAATNPNATLTAFLPNDAAFYRLVREVTGSYPASEQAAFDAVVSLGVDTVGLVLRYHVFDRDEISYREALASNGASLPMLAGGNVGVSVKRFVVRYVELVDQDLNDPNPIVVQPNIGGEAVNGFAHGISLVLRPVDLP